MRGAWVDQQKAFNKKRQEEREKEKKKIIWVKEIKNGAWVKTYPELNRYFSEEYEKRQEAARLKTERIMAEFNAAVDEHLMTVKLLSRCLSTRRQPDLTSPL